MSIKPISFIILSLCIISEGISSAQQKYSDICNNQEDYIIAEGWGKSVQEADTQALSSLSGAISLNVRSSFRQREVDRKDAYSTSGERSIESDISVFSCSTLEGSGMEILSKGKKAHVVRWIAREEVERMLSLRKEKAYSLTLEAYHAGLEGRTADALRCLYWASSLLETIPERLDLSGDIPGYGNVNLTLWTSQMLCSTLDDIQVKAANRSGNDVILQFSSNGKTLKGVDFRYFDGRAWSPLLHCSSDKAVIELSPGALGEHIPVRIEYCYEDAATFDRDLYGAISRSDNVTLRNAVKVATR